MEPDDGVPPEVRELFEAFLERWYSDPQLTIEALFLQHPQHREALQKLHDEWQRVVGLLDRCKAAESFSSRVHRQFGSDVNPNVRIKEEHPSSRISPDGQVIDRLVGESRASSRYTIRAEVARGGMGCILRVWDEDLQRHLAMKRLEIDEQGASHLGKLARFLEEAQVTGQLDHPGIVPVHELGFDAEDRPFFTMRLVKGQTLKEIFDRVHKHDAEWTQSRALSVMMKVCEAMAYAHSKGVVHRDLKPANIMVGRFGETYVMDWGLARVLGRDDTKDIRISPENPASVSVMHTVLQGQREQAPDSPLVTMDGDVVGTPSYMAPEQANGRLQEVGPRSDVYSFGCMLYHLLTGQTPYLTEGARLSQRTLLARVIDGPPKPIHALSPEAPAELVAICEKAMARAPQDRYADMTALESDLRAYLENRVVQAHRTGGLIEFKKWVQRNRGMAQAIAAAVLIGFLGLGTVAVVYRVGRDAALSESHKVRRLKNSLTLRELLTKEAALWPALPENTDTLVEWMEKAERLSADLDDHRRARDELRNKATLAVDGSLLFVDEADEWLYQENSRLITELEQFRKVTIPSVEKRIDVARSITEETVTKLESEWTDAIDTIESTPAYHGLRIKAQVGLVPLEPDPQSSLYEFLVWGSGETPERDARSQRYVINDRTGIVLVLLPAGQFKMGSTSTPGESYDKGFVVGEEPPHSVSLAAFFIAKYELTQGQWLRLAGANPSSFQLRVSDVERPTLDPTRPLSHPVEQVSWDDCHRLLPHWHLLMPTESQWEYAARAGTKTPWWTSADDSGLADAANLLDQKAKIMRAGVQDDYTPWDDGWETTAPVGSYRANAFGLHDTAGNVAEWCESWWADYSRRLQGNSGERESTEADKRHGHSLRGGGFQNSPAVARSACRRAAPPAASNQYTGVRPARKLDE